MIGSIFLVGTIARLLPLLNEQSLMYSISEDGYYMLTIARNIAMGLGMSVSDGTIPTNGTQPFMTFIFSIIYLITSGDKIQSLRFILLLQFIISVCGAVLIYKFGKNLFQNNEYKYKVGFVSSALWYASTISIANTMNGLETGLYAVAIFFVLYLFVFRFKKNTYRDYIFPGIILGILFLIRNDAVFFILAICSVVFFKYNKDESVYKKFVNIFIIIISSIIIGLPWLLYNKIYFGSFTPISGIAQMNEGGFAGNLIYLPGILTEYLLVMIPIPNRLEMNPIVIFICSVFIVSVIYLILRHYKNLERAQKTILLIMSVFIAELCIFYGVFFGASWFLQRYLFPVSAIMTLVSVSILFKASEKYNSKRKIKEWLFLSFSLIIILIFIVHGFAQLKKNPYFKYTNWVVNNVDKNVWVGALQSGTLGYFHDKTINLDGKVNPEAFKARMEKRLGEYAEEKKIKYIVDWISFLEVMDYYLPDGKYKILIQSNEQDLVVLKYTPR